jgi:hypothetical protein
MLPDPDIPHKIWADGLGHIPPLNKIRHPRKKQKLKRQNSPGIQWTSIGLEDDCNGVN